MQVFVKEPTAPSQLAGTERDIRSLLKELVWTCVELKGASRYGL